MTEHLEPSTLQLYLRHQLPAEQERAVEAHVETCPECERTLDRLTAGDLPADRVLLRDIPGYDILGELGRGGMGVVYKALQREAARLVAVKTIRGYGWFGPEQLARFRNEAQSLARLRHPNIVQVYDVGTWQGTPYFSMELVLGGSLAARLKGNPLPAREAAQLAETLAQAVEAAHQAGVIHRDLKPANILLQIADCGLRMADSSRDTPPADQSPGPDTETPAVKGTSAGRNQGSGVRGQKSEIPKISDFGLARQLDQDERQTATGEVMGTPGYMAPEQAGGQGKRVGPAADVYALGAVLYECLTGRPPFQGPTAMETVLQVLEVEPVAPGRLQRSVPRDLETICLKCLQKEPAKRYPSAVALAADLGRYLRGEPIQARPVGRLERARKWARRQPLGAALVAVTVLGVLALAGLSVGLWRSLQDREAALLAASKATAAARDSEAQTRQLLYAADLKAVSQLWKAGDIPRMKSLLQRHAKTVAESGGPDFAWNYFSRLVEQLEAPAFRCPGGEVLAVALSADGRLVATGSQDGKVRLWDAQTRKALATLARHDGAVTSLTFLPGSKALASCGTDGAVRVWDPVAHRELAEPFRPGLDKGKGPPGRPVHIVVTSDGRHVATAAADDGTVEVWDRVSGKRCHSLPAGGAVGVVALSADGDTVAISTPYPFRVYDLPTGKEIYKDTRAFDVLDLALSGNGWLLAVAQRNGAILVRWTGREDLRALYGWQPDQTFSAGPSPVRRVTFAPDGETLALAGDDAIIRLWHPLRGLLPIQFRGHTDRVAALAFSADGRTLVSGSADGTVRFWDVEKPPGHLPLPGLIPQPAGPIAFSPDGKTFAVAFADHTVGLLDPATGGVRAVCRGHSGVIRSLAFSPDSSVLATVGLDRTLRLWSPTDGQSRACRPLPSLPHAVAVSAEGLVAVGMEVGGVRCWEAPSAKPRAPFPHSEPVVALAFLADGKTLLTVGGEKFVRTWDVGTRQGRPLSWKADGALGALAVSPDGKLLATADLVNQRLYLADTSGDRAPLTLEVVDTKNWSLAFSGDGRTLAVPRGNVVFLLDVPKGTVRHAIDASGRARVASFHPDGRTLATVNGTAGPDAYEDCRIAFWDLKKLRLWAPPHQRPGPVTALAYSPDGTRLLIGSRPRVSIAMTNLHVLGKQTRYNSFVLRDDDVRVWDLAAGREELPLLPGQLGLGVHAMALVPGGRTLLLGSEGGTVWRHDLAGRKGLPLRFVTTENEAYWEIFQRAKSVWPLSRPNYTRTVRALAVSSSGAQFATAADDGTVQVWDAAQGQVRLTLPHQHRAVAGLAFDPRGEMLAVNDAEQVRLWDPTTGQPRGTLTTGHREPILSLAYSPDGKVLATGSQDRHVLLWDMTDLARPPLVCAGHVDVVSCLAFTPDGRVLASGSWDGTVRLWHVATAQELAALDSFHGKIYCLTFSPDGHTLAAGGHSATHANDVVLWSTNPVPPAKK